MRSQLWCTAMTVFPNPDPLDTWIEVLDNFMPFDPKVNALYFELLARAERDSEIKKMSTKNLGDEIDMVTEQIASQQRRGLISADADPRIIAITLISAFNGMRMMVLLGIGRDEVRRRWIELGRIILGIKDDQSRS